MSSIINKNGNTLQKLPETQKEEEFTCEICIEPTSNKFKNGDKCSHLFCTKCMIKYITVKVDDDNVGHIGCPALDCDHTLDPLACALLVGAPLHMRWTEAALVEDCRGTQKKSKCSSCKRFFCFKCKRFGRTEFRPEENANDVAFERLARWKRWTRCPMCRHFVEKAKGCNTIRCRCGINFCYGCGNEICRCGIDFCYKCGNTICRCGIDFCHKCEMLLVQGYSCNCGHDAWYFCVALAVLIAIFVCIVFCSS